jgi:Secretion system C-terminal sorting domain
MNRWLCTVVILMTAAPHAVQSQKLERQAIVPAGSSGVVSGVRISSTTGQPASAHGRNDGLNLTQGFQQPYFQFGRIVAEDFGGNAGDSREMKLTLSLVGGEIAAAKAIRLKLRFNATLLQPIGATQGATTVSDSIANGRRTVEMLLPIQSFAPSPIELTTLRFMIGLGNDSISAVEILDAVPVGGPVALESVAGKFTLTGICYEGGPRLVNPVKRATIGFKPNPVASLAELEFELFAQAKTRIALVDMFGREVRMIVDGQFDAGRYTVTYDMSTVPSGSYMLVLNTASQRITRNLVVQH